MHIRETFAANLRKQRKAAGLTQEKLAEAAGLHRTYIGGIEQCRVNVSLKNVGKIADALGIDPAMLFIDGDIGPGADAWKQAADAGALAGHPAAVAIWDDDGNIDFEPIDSAYKDITVHVLVSLIGQGYAGDALAERYRATTAEIIRFLER